MDKKMEDCGHLRRYERIDIGKKLAQKYGERFVLYRAAWDRATNEHVVPDAPLYIALGINSDCNLKCKMCTRNFDSSRNNRHINMPLSLVEKIVSQAKEFYLPSVLIGADSECLLHPQFKEVVKKVKELDPVDFFVISNGTLLTEDVAACLVKSGVDRLEVSVDAAIPESYQKIRGGDLHVLEANLHTFLSVREQLHSETPFLRLSFCVQSDNADEQEAFLEKWKDKADVVDFQDLVDFSHAADLVEVPDHEYWCGQPFQRLLIDFEGNIYPCCCSGYYRYLRLGNIAEMTLMEAWHSPKMNAIRESFLTQQLNKVCLNCSAMLATR